MAAQEDYDNITEILTRAGYTDEERESFTGEVMEKLGYKLKRIFLDDDTKSPSGPRRIGQPGGSSQRAVGQSQYRD